MNRKTPLQTSRETALSQLAAPERGGKPLSVTRLRNLLESRRTPFTSVPATYTSRMETGGFLMTGRTGFSFEEQGMEVRVFLTSTCGHSYTSSWSLSVGDFLREMDITGWTTASFEALLETLPALKKDWQAEEKAECRKKDKENMIDRLKAAALRARLEAALAPLSHTCQLDTTSRGVDLATMVGGRGLILRFPADPDPVPTTHSLKECLATAERLCTLFGRYFIVGMESARFHFPAVERCSLQVMHQAFSMLDEVESCLPAVYTVTRERSYAMVSGEVCGISVSFKLPYEDMEDLLPVLAEGFILIEDLCGCLPFGTFVTII